MSDMNSSADAGSQPQLSAGQRIIGVFLSPGKTFEDLDRRPDWILPLVIILIITLAFTIITSPITMPEQMDKQRVKMEERGMSDEQIEQALTTGEKVGKILAPIGAIVGTTIMLLIFTLMVWFVGNIVLGGQTTFKKIFSVYNYSSLIGALGMIVTLPVVLAKKTANVHFSLASFLSDDQSQTLLYKILRSFGVFSIWQYIVLAIGFAAIYKFSMKKSGWTIVVLFLIYVMITVVLSQIFGF